MDTIRWLLTISFLLASLVFATEDFAANDFQDDDNDLFSSGSASISEDATESRHHLRQRHLDIVITDSPTVRPTSPPKPTPKPIPQTKRPTRRPTRPPTPRPVATGGPTVASRPPECGTIPSKAEPGLLLGPYTSSWPTRNHEDFDCSNQNGNWFVRNMRDPEYKYTFRVTKKCEYQFYSPATNKTFQTVEDVNAWFDQAAEILKTANNVGYRVTGDEYIFSGTAKPSWSDVQTKGVPDCPEDYCVLVTGPSVIRKSNVSPAPTLVPTPMPTYAPTPAEPELARVGNNGSPSSLFPLGVCEGDCDRDSECEAGLVCFDRTRKETVPGCAGLGISGTDYCYNPNYTYPENTLPRFSRLHDRHKPFAKCFGDCDRDSDCIGDLLCWMSNDPVPGCTGPADNGDYCYDPNDLSLPTEPYLLYAFSSSAGHYEFWKFLQAAINAAHDGKIFGTNHFQRCKCESFCVDEDNPFDPVPVRATCYTEHHCGERTYQIAYADGYPEQDKAPWHATGTMQVMDWFDECATAMYGCTRTANSDKTLYRGGGWSGYHKFPRVWMYDSWQGYDWVYGIGGNKQYHFPLNSTRDGPVVAWSCPSEEHQLKLEFFGDFVEDAEYMREAGLGKTVPTLPCAEVPLVEPSVPDATIVPVGPDCDQFPDSKYCVQMPGATCYVTSTDANCENANYFLVDGSGTRSYETVTEWNDACLAEGVNCHRMPEMAEKDGNLTLEYHPRPDTFWSALNGWELRLNNRNGSGGRQSVVGNDRKIYYNCGTWEDAYGGKNFTQGAGIFHTKAVYENSYGDLYQVTECTEAPSSAPSSRPSISAAPSSFPSMQPSLCAESYLTSENLNIALVLDLSYSTYRDSFSGEKPIGDVNGDGKNNTILDAQVAAVQDLLTNIGESNELRNSNSEIALIGFETDAYFHGVWAPLAPSDDAFNPLLMDYIKTNLRAPTSQDAVIATNNGYTNFDAALDVAVSYFQNNATSGRKNLLVFLSDGEPNVRGDGDNETYCEDTVIQKVNGVNTNITCADLNLIPGERHNFCRGNDPFCFPNNNYQKCVRGSSYCLNNAAVTNYDSEINALAALNVERLAIGVGNESNVAYGSALWTIDNNPAKYLGVLPLQALDLDELSEYLSSLCILNTEPPTSSPSYHPSQSPSVSMVPSASPSQAPSTFPSSAPTPAPTGSPSDKPSMVPSGAPSSEPSMVPSGSPTQAPTATHSDEPSSSPSKIHSSAPSSKPSHVPSLAPSVSNAPSASYVWKGDGTKCPVGDKRLMKDTDIDTLEDCYQLCALFPGCNYFSFNSLHHTGGNQCIICQLDSDSELSNNGASSFVAYKLTSPKPPSEFGFDLWTSDSGTRGIDLKCPDSPSSIRLGKIFVNTRQECYDSCSNTPGCASFTFGESIASSSHRGTCILCRVDATSDGSYNGADGGLYTFRMFLDPPSEAPSTFPSRLPSAFPSLVPSASPSHVPSATPRNNNDPQRNGDNSRSFPSIGPVDCPEDILLVKLEGVTELPAGAVTIQARNATHATVTLEQKWNPLGDMDAVYYQYRANVFSNTCQKAQDFSPGPSNALNISITCTHGNKLALLELWIADDLGKGILQPEDDAVVPECCHSVNSQAAVTEYVVAIRCQTECP